LGVLNGGLGISKLQFLILKNISKQIPTFGSGSGPEIIKMLDPDADPQPYIKRKKKRLTLFKSLKVELV
jgi:hypothetical protein